MLLYIIRHGETNLNVKGYLQGQVEEPLNENGRNIARITGEALSDVPFDLVITSPLSRAKESAVLATNPSARKHGRRIPVIEDDRLMEIYWGSWEGCGCRESNYSVPVSLEQYKQFMSDPFSMTGPSDGEDVHQVIKRTGEFFQELIHRTEYQDKTILISTHGFAMRALLNPLYENPQDFWHGHVPYNCAVNILKVEHGKTSFIEEDAVFYDKSLCFDHYQVEDENTTGNCETRIRLIK